MKESLVELVPALGHSHVRMKDPDFVEKAVRIMMKDAHHKLQNVASFTARLKPDLSLTKQPTSVVDIFKIVADFDRTLSKYAEDGRICSTTHNVLEESRYMPEYFKEEARKLKDTYLPIEFDHSRTIEEKIPLMIEWWTKGHELVTSCHLTRDVLQHIVAESFARLRNGCKWFFEQLHQLDIPILIFSAGIGDVIHETILQQASFYTNMKIVSNFLKFDEQGQAVGFVDEIIHTFNKNENTIHSSDYFYNIRHRENLLLMGDSIGDLGMSEGADHVECELKIGFLNFKVEENLPSYLESFDVVIIEDESMDVINGIVKVILGIAT